MVLVGNGEFLGLEKRNGKNNDFYYLKFLDDNFDNYRFYCPVSCEFDIMPHQLESRERYKLTFNYKRNDFQNRYELQLLNIQILEG